MLSPDLSVEERRKESTRMILLATLLNKYNLIGMECYMGVLCEQYITIYILKSIVYHCDRTDSANLDGTEVSVYIPTNIIPLYIIVIIINNNYLVTNEALWKLEVESI